MSKNKEKKGYYCERCNVKFPTPSKLKRHNDRKTPCVKLAEKKPPKYYCKFCNHNFKYLQGLTRHLDRCKIRFDAIQEEKTRSIAQEFEKKLETEFDKRMQSYIDNIKTAPTYNSYTVNILCMDFRQPNVKFLLEDPELVKKIMRQGIHGPNMLIDKIYFNPTHRENMLIYVADHLCIRKINGMWKRSTPDDIVKDSLDVTLDVVRKMSALYASQGDLDVMGRERYLNDYVPTIECSLDDPQLWDDRLERIKQGSEECKKAILPQLLNEIKATQEKRIVVTE